MQENMPTTGQAIADLLGCGIGAVQKRFEAVRSARFPSKGWDETWKWNPANPLPKDCAKSILISFLGDYQEVILPIIQPPSSLSKDFLAQRRAFADLEKEHAGLKNAFADLGKALEDAVAQKESANVMWQKKHKEWEDLVHRYNDLFDSSKTTQNAFADLEKRFAVLEKENQILSQNGKTNDATFADLGKQKAAFAELAKDFANLEKERNTFANSAKRFPILEKDFAELAKRFADLEKETVELRQIRKTGGAAFADLGKDYDSLQGRFADLEKENAVWKARFADLENGNLSFSELAKAELEKYKTGEALNRKQLKDNETEIHDLLDKNKHLGHANEVLKERNGRLQEELSVLKEFRQKYVDLKEQWDKLKMDMSEKASEIYAFIARYGRMVGTAAELSGFFRCVLGITESVFFYFLLGKTGFHWFISGILALLLAAAFQGKLLAVSLEAAADVAVNRVIDWVLDIFAIAFTAILLTLAVKISLETRLGIQNAYPVSIVDSAKVRVIKERYDDSTNLALDRFKLDTNVARNNYRKNISVESRKIDKWSTEEDKVWISSQNEKDSLAMVKICDAADKRKLGKITHFKTAYEDECKMIPNIIRNDYGNMSYFLDMISIAFITISALAVAIYKKKTEQEPRIESIPMRIWAKWSREWWSMIEKWFKI